MNITNQHESSYQYNKPCSYFFIANFEEHQEDIYPKFHDHDEYDGNYFDEIYQEDD